MSQLDAVWSRVVLDPGAKARLLEHVGRFNDHAVPPPRGLLIWGPPGTGKSTIIRCIADSVKGTFMRLGAEDLCGEFIGQTSARVREVWRKARSHGRCVISVDWCEGIFASRDSPHNTMGRDELVLEFLLQWDQPVEQGGGVWFVGETYRPEPIDAAILSRFDTLIETRLPGSWAERAAIIEVAMREVGLASEIPGFAEAATAGMSGRNLFRLVTEVYRQAESQREAPASAATWRVVLERLKSSQ
jgi:transitional endoplasmic reticulum ATPase